jgi:hypothetical protein
LIGSFELNCDGRPRDRKRGAGCDFHERQVEFGARDGDCIRRFFRGLNCERFICRDGLIPAFIAGEARLLDRDGTRAQITGGRLLL